MTRRGAKWATSKIRKNEGGPNWNTRIGTVLRLPLDRTLAMIVWDGTTSGKPVPRIFLRVLCHDA